MLAVCGTAAARPARAVLGMCSDLPGSEHKARGPSSTVVHPCHQGRVGCGAFPARKQRVCMEHMWRLRPRRGYQLGLQRAGGGYDARARRSLAQQPWYSWDSPCPISVGRAVTAVGAPVAQPSPGRQGSLDGAAERVESSGWAICARQTIIRRQPRLQGKSKSENIDVGL